MKYGEAFKLLQCWSKNVLKSKQDARADRMLRRSAARMRNAVAVQTLQQWSTNVVICQASHEGRSLNISDAATHKCMHPIPEVMVCRVD